MSGLIAPSGTTGQLLETIRGGLMEAVVSWDLAHEIVEVLRRPSIRRYGVTEGDVDAVLAVLGPLLPDVDVTVELRDANDTPVVAAALAGRADAIVTGDPDLLDDGALIAWLAGRGIEVITPAEALAAVASR